MQFGIWNFEFFVLLLNRNIVIKVLGRKLFEGPRESFECPSLAVPPFGVRPGVPRPRWGGARALPTADIRQMHFLCSTLLVCGRYDLLSVYSRIQISSCCSPDPFCLPSFLPSLLSLFLSCPSFAAAISPRFCARNRLSRFALQRTTG